MTHPNLQTNGASLEDCHTNFFALVRKQFFYLIDSVCVCVCGVCGVCEKNVSVVVDDGDVGVFFM